MIYTSSFFLKWVYLVHVFVFNEGYEKLFKRVKQILSYYEMLPVWIANHLLNVYYYHYVS